MVDDLMIIRKENDEESSKLRNKLCIQNNVISELKDDLKQKIDSQDEHEDVSKLIEDIRHLQIVNEEKETELENITEENETLKNKLKVIESKAEEENECLDDELGSNVNRKFKCKTCDKQFVSHTNLRSRIRSDHRETDSVALEHEKL